jgi:hypothetical protein
MHNLILSSELFYEIGIIKPILQTRKGSHSQAPEARACNPSNLGDRDKEDHGSKPTWAE